MTSGFGAGHFKAVIAMATETSCTLIKGKYYVRHNPFNFDSIFIKLTDDKDNAFSSKFCEIRPFTLQSLYYATHYNTVLVLTRSGLGSQMVIF